ncbi:flagellar biosynthesis anti-sigma factor FlgM [Rhodanobacter denitrificans]|uniref:Negative regulator of flagellin synthesis n=1 Tax=Rhodanobacter denitrificans TaxID=666685 RepID=A0A368KEM4_9GAMM|nr:flagellar biosynthesis anti-sigma factor FlgM [Rhodanobacter denitrificans]RCS30361.1 flagellar biosynthesis anti-sigma factor FlgM [Rhodanobacter denitrificans]
MNTTISNNGLPKFPQAANSPGNGAATPAPAPAASGAPAAKADDQLKLTDSALALQQAARTDDSAAIDPQRVERLRTALADGSYRIDAGRIADRMISLDQQLGGTGKA